MRQLSLYRTTWTKRLLRVTLIAVLFPGTASAQSLPGLTDALVHAPPAIGPFAYNSFVPLLTEGASYVDPVFGTTVRRVTTDHVDDDIYARNMWWSADGTRYLHRTTNGTPWADYWEVINAATGTVTHQGIPNGTMAADGGFDPADPNALYYLNGNQIHKVTLNADGTWSDAVYFSAPATLGSLGGTINWFDAGGRYMLVRYGSEPSVYLYDRQDMAAGPYTNPINGTPYVDSGSYLGLSPDGQYVVGYQSGAGVGLGMGQGVSWKIDHANRTIAPVPTIFWDLCGDHGSFLSASDGHNYMIVNDCNYQAGLWRVDITNSIVGLTGYLSEAVQQALPNNKLLLAYPTWNDFGHYSTVARGPLQDWVFLSTEDGSDTFNSGTADANGNITPWHAYRQEIVAINVITGEIRRLAHHRSRSVGSNYYYTPRVSVSWGGENVAFASNFNQSDTVDIYAVQFAATSDPTTTTTTTTSTTTTTATLTTSTTTTTSTTSTTQTTTTTSTSTTTTTATSTTSTTTTTSTTSTTQTTTTTTTSTTTTTATSTVGTSINTGLVGYWKFDEGSGTTAYDSSGNGNTGTLVNGPTWTTGKINGALSFDGLNDYVRIPNRSGQDAYPLTVSVWMKTTTAGLNGIVNKYYPSSMNGYQLFMNAGNLCAWYFKDSSNYIWDGGGCTLQTPGYNDNQWHHVVFVVDASCGRLYVDGAQTATQGWTGAPGAPTTTLPISIGRYPGTANPYFPGLLDDVRIYNRALSAAEVFSLYSSASPTVENIIWTNLVNTTATGNSLQKTSGCDGCPDAGATSQQQIALGDGYVEFTASETTTLRYAGLSNGNPGTTGGEIAFAIRLQSGIAEVRENGVYRTDTTFVNGDLFRVGVESGVVKYYKNGGLFYTSVAAPIYPLITDAAIYNLNGTITNAVISTK